MKKLRLKNWVRYLMIGILDLYAIFNLPNILKDTESINDYRFNILIVAFIIIFNVICISMILNVKNEK